MLQPVIRLFPPKNSIHRLTQVAGHLQISSTNFESVISSTNWQYQHLRFFCLFSSLLSFILPKQLRFMLYPLSGFVLIRFMSKKKDCYLNVLVGALKTFFLIF